MVYLIIQYLCDPVNTVIGLAIVEAVRDGTTFRVRLMMPEGEHQFVNVALAGVRSARAASKQGEPSEQWGEEVSAACRLRVFLVDITKALA